jgi:hypothetical protein
MESNEIYFPPYGVLNDHFLDVIQEHPLFPNDWRSLRGSHLTLGEQWRIWKEETLDIIAAVLWPRYEPGGGWRGTSKDSMNALTEADLRLMPYFRTMLEQPVSAHTGITHREFFEIEDTQAKPFGSMHPAYDPTMPFRLLEKMPRVMSWSLGAKAGTAAPQFKKVLQRPRGYQIALMLSHNGFHTQRAITSDSPSICSGHAYEGTMMTAGIIELFLRDREPLTKDQWTAIQQFAVDIGDRRVMAGVHYPSDNLASWLMVMRIAPRVFRIAEIKDRLWHAISQQSHVYTKLCETAQGTAGEVYRPALQALQDAAQESWESADDAT